MQGQIFRRNNLAHLLPPGSYTVFPLSIATSMSLVSGAGNVLDFLHRFNENQA